MARTKKASTGRVPPKTSNNRKGARIANISPKRSIQYKDTGPPDLRQISSRKEITAVTMNMNGRTGLGLTPRYKIEIVRKQLTHVPDMVFIQDSIDYGDIMKVLSEVSNGMYDWHFNPDLSSDSSSLTEHHRSSDHQNGDEDCDSKSVTGIAWNKDKYLGTPLQMGGYNTVKKYRLICPCLRHYLPYR